jgi:hypothetical protein
MNEPSKQPNSVEQETHQALAKVQDLCREAYSSGYRAGYQKGFEYGVGIGMGQVPKYPNEPKIA